MTTKDIRKELQKFEDPARAKQAAKYFQCHAGGYGEGDHFIGLKVPETRLVAKKFGSATLPDLKPLIRSEIHEERLLSLMILSAQAATAQKRGDEKSLAKIVKFYLSNLKYVNNWDLVDSSAEFILGPYLINGDHSVLFKLAKSKSVWLRRVAVLTTFHFIRAKKFAPTLKLLEVLLNDDHDLIHKASGWMLREIGKRDAETAKSFLDRYHRIMPRTMLRYAIERLPEKKRLSYLRR